MHGVKRSSQAAVEARRLKENAKLVDYLALQQQVLDRKKNADFSKDAFELTSRILQINPEFYTVWNYRRAILLNGIFPTCSPEQINNLLSDDLSMTTAALKLHPKVYWIWNHRTWCLEHVPDSPHDPNAWRQANWDTEMFFVEKMLDVDPRNFHAWSYRRYILSSMPLPRTEDSELAYTQRKIESNFSNFSAWHQRSKVLTSLWSSGKLDENTSKEEEFALVKNGLYTDPSDQSVWLYHRWLVGSGDDPDLLSREIKDIQDLLDEQPDSKYCMESILHYKRILIHKHHFTDSNLVEDCFRLLASLRELDPARRNRYDDIEADLRKSR